MAYTAIETFGYGVSTQQGIVQTLEESQCHCMTHEKQLKCVKYFTNSLVSLFALDCNTQSQSLQLFGIRCLVLSVICTCNNSLHRANTT